MKRFLATLLLLTAALHAPRALAHPLSQGEIRIVIDGRTITLHLSVPVEEVIVQHHLQSRDDDCFMITREACRQHGDYLLNHFVLSANNSVAKGTITSIANPVDAPIHVLEIARTFVSYDITYAFTTPPAAWELSENVLNEMEYESGNRWEVAYIASVMQGGSVVRENMLLSSTTPLKVALSQLKLSASAPHMNVVAQPATSPTPRTTLSITRIICLIASVFCVIYLFIIRLRRRLNRLLGED